MRRPEQLQMLPDVVAGCSERPQQAERRSVLSQYVEPLRAARTLLAAFINSLLDVKHGVETLTD
jgi:hypothetical protein